jgi:SAM-dependent methyltransferase
LPADAFWRNNSALAHITPPGERWPEGDGLLERVAALMPEGRVLEFGCGDGRLAAAFPPERYAGADINQHALDRCRALYPGRTFVSADGQLPEADVCLAWTVLLHVPDESIGAVVARLMSFRRVVVGEILGRRWRGPNEPRVFNRELAEYANLFEPMQLVAVDGIHCRRYNATLTVMDFRHGPVRDAP